MSNQKNDENESNILERLKKSPSEIINFYKAEKLIIKDYIEGKQDVFKFRIYENIIVIPGNPDWVFFIDNEDKFHWVSMENVSEIIYSKKSKDFFLMSNIIAGQELVNQLISMQGIQKREVDREGIQ